MKLLPIALFCAAGTACLAGCVSGPAALAPVGPGPGGRPAAGSDGYVEVFTATHRVDVDFEAYFNPHLSYEIEDASGRTVKSVANHSSDMDEAPDVVALPPGRYVVVGQSTWCGLVAVPVVIERGRTTVVRLDGSWHGRTSGPDLVRLPNGEAVGWSAAIGS